MANAKGIISIGRAFELGWLLVLYLLVRPGYSRMHVKLRNVPVEFNDMNKQLWINLKTSTFD